jgi:glycosyltransferase involved in cell wall biosynthesis
MVGANSRVLEVPAGYGRTTSRRIYDALARRIPRAAEAVRYAASRLGGGSLRLPRSTGFVEGLGVDLIHFTTPQAYLTDLPSIYQPHDLLHRHFPEQFSPVHARYRDHAYRTFSQRASVVAVMTEFGRNDLREAYGLPADRMAVVPWAPVAGTTKRHSPSAETAELPARFVLYPAQTWPHKNHLRLLEALAILRDNGTVVQVVCTGRQTDHMGALARRMNELRLGDQVRFTGYLEQEQLDGVLTRAFGLVFPSLFEGWGLPVVEAFGAGVPVAASNTTALPEVTGGAALLFDPEDPRAIADAVSRIWEEAPLRADLQRRGKERAGELSWDRTARVFRAIYRRIALRNLTSDDRDLVGPPTFQAA